MNRGDVMQKLAVQQMMGGSSNWWNMRPPISQQVASATHLHNNHVLPPNNLLPSLSPSLLLPTSTSWNDNQDQLPESWSQLLLGGGLVVGGEDKSENLSNNMQVKKLENEWDEQALILSQNDSVANVNQKNVPNSYMYEPSWSQMTPVSSPKSCVTTVSSSNMLDFSNKKLDARRQPPDHHSSECNSRAANKKARVQSSSAQCTFKVRKEKLGDRITALHQLVSPFGKTDTASVLLEAIGYIRFLQSQIEALSLPYLGSGSRNMRQQHQQQAVHEKNSLFPEDPGQLSNENCLKRKANSEQDLQSRGLCLVPLSCTLQVESDNGADYWAPAFGGGFR